MHNQGEPLGIFRRGLLQASLASGLAAGLGGRARAQGKPEKLVYVGDNGPWHDCLLHEVAPAFEKATGIKIDFTLLPIDALVARLKAELSSGEGGIDIVQWDASMAGWVSGHMQDHMKLIANAASRHPDFDWADFLPAVQKMATYGGKLSGIPYRVTTGILHYQKRLLEQAGFSKPPSNFAELLAAAQATTKQGLPNRYGLGFMGRQGPAMLGSFTPFLRSAGGRYYDPTTGEIFVNEPAAVDALQFYGDLMTKYQVVNPASLTWEFDGIIAGGQNDQFAMTVTLAPYGDLMNDPKVSKTGNAWAWSLMPGKDTISQTATYLAGWMIGVPTGTRNTDWAFDFVQMATSKKWMRRSIDLGNAPPRVSVLQDPGVLAEHPWAPVQGEALKTAVLDHRDPVWAAAQLPLRTAISQVLLGQRTAKQALAEVTQQWHRSFRLAGLKG
ncbi:MAG TPA: extracellular solute-binding protein [Acetobacteraceae bacterium]|nr:extracellular solute-binding protein [Acetobacteraceae bacterium]